LTGENRRTRRKTCPSATLYTTNSTRIDPGANPGLRGERPATNHLRHGTPPDISFYWRRDEFFTVTVAKWSPKSVDTSCHLTTRAAQKIMPNVYFAANIYLKIMKITHTQVRRLVSEPYFFTKSPSTSTALRQRERSACTPCRYDSLSCSFMSPDQNDGPRFHLM
jgi:hypothetical protein